MMMMMMMMALLCRAAPSPPRIVAGYRRQIPQRAGTTMRLDCPVSAEPSALVSWYKDGQEINIAWDRYRVIVAGGPTGTLRRQEVLQLRVRNVTATDSGVYECMATNGFGTVRVSMQVVVYRTYVT